MIINDNLMPGALTRCFPVFRYAFVAGIACSADVALAEQALSPDSHSVAEHHVFEVLADFWVWITLFWVAVLPPVGLLIYSSMQKVRANERYLAEAEQEWVDAMELLEEPIYMLDLKDRIIRGNRAFYQRIQSSPQEAVGADVKRFFHPDGEETPCPVCQARLDCQDAVITLEADDPRNHSGKPMELTVKVVRDKSGAPRRIIQGIRDLSRIREAEQVIRKSEKRFRDLLNYAPDALLICDTRGMIVYVNSAFQELFGYKIDEIVNQPIEVLIPQGLREQHVKQREKYNKTREVRLMGARPDLVAQRKDGSHFPVEVTLGPIDSVDGPMVTAIMRDITIRLNEEQELERLASIPQLSPMPIIEATPKGKVIFMNPKASMIFPDLEKRGGDHPVLKGIDELVIELKNEYTPIIREVQVGGLIYEQQISYRKDSGVVRIYSWDITSLQRLAERMAHQATHDSLTGLVNRRDFERRINDTYQNACVDNTEHALCYIDLDQFKVVNDTCGHLAGDELLQELSSMLQKEIRSGDTLARLGGDEFGMLLTACNLERARAIATNICQLVSEYRYVWKGRSFRIGASIGLVPIDKHSGSAMEAMRAADAACYLAKEHGRNQVCVSRDHDKEMAMHTRDMNLKTRIETALEENHFILYSQKILPVKPELEGNSYQEILLRMNDNGKVVSPMGFLPAAERYDLMREIDIWVVRHSLMAIDDGLVSGCCSINLSGQTLGDSATMNSIINLVNNYTIDNARICFEITETSMISNLSRADRYIRTLRGMGCKFALDDFGTGLSSFSYLKNLPVDVIKIDGEFVRGVGNDLVSRTIVESIVKIGQEMNLLVVVEGVEDLELKDVVTELGVDYVQGFGIHRPAPLEEQKEEDKQIVNR